MLYAFDNLNLITDETLEEMIHDMPIERQRKANSYKNINDKKTCAMAYYILCNGLKEEYNIEIPAEELENLTTIGKVIDYLKSVNIEA